MPPAAGCRHRVYLASASSISAPPGSASVAAVAAGNIERQPRWWSGIDSGVVQRNRPGRTVQRARQDRGAAAHDWRPAGRGEVDQRRKQHHRRRRSRRRPRGCSSMSTVRWPPAESAAITMCSAAKPHTCITNPRLPARRWPRSGNSSAAPVGNRLDTTVARSMTTARMSAAGGFRANIDGAAAVCVIDGAATGSALIALLCGPPRPFADDPASVRQNRLTCSTRVPASEANIAHGVGDDRREAPYPHGPSGGIAPVMGHQHHRAHRYAPRDRSDPRAGTPSVMQRSQFNLLTSVNGSAGSSRDPSRCRAGGRSLLSIFLGVVGSAGIATSWSGRCAATPRRSR